MESKETIKWLSGRFNIPAEDILWYNPGICYSRIRVKTREAAENVHNAVKHETVNGGMLHGMPLGGISEGKNQDDNVYYDVTC